MQQGKAPQVPMQRPKVSTSYGVLASDRELLSFLMTRGEVGPTHAPIPAMVVLALAFAITAEDLGIAGLEILPPGRLDADERAVGVACAAVTVQGADEGFARIVWMRGEGVCVEAGGHGARRSRLCASFVQGLSGRS